MDTDNFRKRVLHKLAETLNLPKLTFQVIRGTIATLSQAMGTVKDTQGVLRHSRTQTGQDVYVHIIPAGVEQMINSNHGELSNPVGSRATEGA